MSNIYKNSQLYDCIDLFLMAVQEVSAGVRLFDRGDLNSYEDELRFLLVLATCCRGACFSDILDMKHLTRLHSSFSSFLSDIKQLISTVRSASVDSIFRPSTQVRRRDDLVALTRRYVAARWLRHVLISNNVIVDDMQDIRGDMMDISRRCVWLSDFISV